jgi:autotransporter strand-loop-strand O-heptosyltransferase
MDVNIKCHFIDGAFIEITGDEKNDKKYLVKFINDDTGKIEYQTILEINRWAKTAKKYFVNWKIQVVENDKLIFEHKIDFKNKNVLIELCSSSLGDTLAWFPAIDEFQKKFNCNVYCSTFLNNLFKDNYKNLKFVNPGDGIEDIYAQYRIGWFYDGDSINYDLNPYDFKKFHLQDTAFQVLGIPFVEKRPKLNVPVKDKKNQVCIGIHSTAQSKYWNNENGWQHVVDYLNSKNYDVLLITKEHNGWMGNKILNGVIDKTGNFSLQDRIDQLAESKLFIGLGSGLSWLAWSTGIDTILISGFSEPYAEFKATERIINENVCHGCFNNVKLDPSDWNWCPSFKNTDKQFICTKEISPTQVIDAINKVLNL